MKIKKAAKNVKENWIRIIYKMIDKIKRIKTNKRYKHISHSVDLSIVRISTGKIHSKLARLFPEGSTKIWNSHHRCFHLIRCFIKSKSCFLSFCHIFFLSFIISRLGFLLPMGPTSRKACKMLYVKSKPWENTAYSQNQKFPWFSSSLILWW